MAGYTESFGFKLRVGNAESPEVYTLLAQITDFGELPGVTRQQIDVSDISSTWAAFAAGQADPGSVTFGVILDLDEATHGNTGDGLFAIAQARGTRNFNIEIPASSEAGSVAHYFQFSGVITSLVPSASQNDVYRAQVTIKISGQWTLGTTAPLTS